MMEQEEIDIGCKGESWFVYQANRINVRAQRPTNGDVYGWDYLLEHQPRKESILQARVRQKSFVQLKTTSAPYETPRLKLSAMLKLVETDIPSFVLHLHYDGNDVVGQWLYHVSDEVMDEAMLKARIAERKLETDPDAKKLNQIDFQFRKKWRIPSYESVADYEPTVFAIVDAAGGSDHYVTNKKSRRDNFGDPSEKLQINWTGKIKDAHQADIDLRNSRTTELSADLFRINMSKKQIFLDGDAIDLSSGRLVFVRHPDEHVDVKFESDEGSFVFYSQPIYWFGTSGSRVTGYEIEGEFLKISCSDNDGTTVTTSLKEDIKYEMRDLLRALHAKSIVNAKSTKFTVYRGDMPILSGSDLTANDVDISESLRAGYLYLKAFTDEIESRFGGETTRLMPITLFEEFNRNKEALTKLFKSEHLIQGIEQLQVGDRVTIEGPISFLNYACDLISKRQVTSVSRKGDEQRIASKFINTEVRNFRRTI